MLLNRSELLILTGLPTLSSSFVEIRGRSRAVDRMRVLYCANPQLQIDAMRSRLQYCANAQLQVRCFEDPQMKSPNLDSKVFKDME